eukprot:CAMPEP_0184681296 /NCGR_PEP_ID=MMETSP0312-20130426/4279_1 /TAXON_ID=31354 /ORGANISM="Compsopogon coeruleus, Strain SAG 36.94" /LENGTH=50 /DNA_ID=CAMNT_0027132055 /DNA_START=192 /DNA_END=347 /DNA_ORIENTATION=+
MALEVLVQDFFQLPPQRGNDGDDDAKIFPIMRGIVNEEQCTNPSSSPFLD